MLAIIIKLDVARELHAAAWKIAAEAYTIFDGARDHFHVEDATGTFEVEVTQTSVLVRGPV